MASRKTTNGVEYNTVYGYVQGNTAYGRNDTTPLVASITQGSGASVLEGMKQNEKNDSNLC